MVPQAAKSASWIDVLRAVSPLADRPWDVAAATPLGPVAAFPLILAGLASQHLGERMYGLFRGQTT